MVNVDIEVLVHGGEGRAVLQFLRGQTTVDHVVVQRVEQLNVDIAHQSIKDFLENSYHS